MSGQAVLEKYDPLIRRGQAAIPNSGDSEANALTRRSSGAANLFDPNEELVTQFLRRPRLEPMERKPGLGSPILRPIDSARD